MTIQKFKIWLPVFFILTLWISITVLLASIQSGETGVIFLLGIILLISLVKDIKKYQTSST